MTHSLGRTIATSRYALAAARIADHLSLNATAWDRKWSGLMKRAPHTAAGHEAAEGGALSERWSVTQAAASA